MEQNLDFCIVITTYNRPEMLNKLLSNIEGEKKDFKIKIFVFDDGSSEKYDLTKFDLSYIRVIPNGGKFNFWKLINKTFSFVKLINSKYYVYLQDDLELTTDFFTNIKKKYEGINDNKKICLEFRTDNRTERPNWTGVPPKDYGDYIRTQWVELDFICEKKFFEVLNYELNPISYERWKIDPNMSSGVGEQLSVRLHSLGYNMYHLKKSLVIHDNHESKMNLIERKQNKLITN